MTAFDLCRQRPELELTPVLRIVKYLGLDSSGLDDGEIGRVVRLYPFFREDPELVIGKTEVAAETDLEPEVVEAVLNERRRDIPYLGTARRPMVPRVALRMIRAAAAGRDPLDFGAEQAREQTTDTDMHPDTHDRTRTLDRRLEEVVAELRSVTRKIDELTEEIRRNGAPGDGNGTDPDPGSRRQRHRRRGGGKPDTIVEACRLVLDDAQGPMKVAEITRKVLSQGVEINAKNPNVTVSSILSSYEVFRRVKRGYYVLTS